MAHTQYCQYLLLYVLLVHLHLDLKKAVYVAKSLLLILWGFCSYFLEEDCSWKYCREGLCMNSKTGSICVCPEGRHGDSCQYSGKPCYHQDGINLCVPPVRNRGGPYQDFSNRIAATMKELVHGMCFHGVLITSYSSFNREGQGQLH